MISTILSAQITARTMSNVMFIRKTGVLMLSLLYLLPLYFQIPRCTYVSSTGSRPGCVGPRRNAAEYQQHPSKTCWIVFGRSPGRRMWTIITSMSTSWRRACTGKKQQSAKVVWHHMAQQSWGINSYLFIYLLKQGFVILSVMTPYGNILFIGRTENCCRGDFCSWRPYGIRHQKPPCVFLNPPIPICH